MKKEAKKPSEQTVRLVKRVLGMIKREDARKEEPKTVFGQIKHKPSLDEYDRGDQ